MSDPFLDALNAQAGPVAPPSGVPRSVRNNNPGNIVFDANNNWQGQTGSDGKFAIFDTPENGDRAHAKLLENYQKLHGINTVRDAITRFAPPSDGNDTGAYIATVAQKLGINPDDHIDLSDPTVNAALRQVQQPIEAGTAQPNSPLSPPISPPAQSSGHDPYLTALDGATSGANAGQPQGGAPADGSSGGSGPVAVADGSGDQNGSWGVGSTVKSVGKSLAAITPLTDSAFNGRNYFSSLRDDAAGFASGALKVPETGLNLVADLADHAPYGEKVAKLLRDSAQQIAGWGDGHLANDPNSSAYGWGKLGGEVGATLPVTEIAPLAAVAKAGKAGKFASALARYGDMALQGGTAGVALSGGHDVGTAALEGAVLAPALGAAGDVLLPAGLKAAGAVSDKAKALAAKLSGGAADEAVPAAAQTIRRATDLPVGNIEITHHGHPFPQAPSAEARAPSSATPDELRTALGSRGSNSGLEANTNLPPEAALHVDRLRMQGVPLEQAIREAEVSHVGAQPTIANVTRNPEDQAAVWEGAKQATPEGRALSAQIAQNNASVVGRVQKLVQDNGGVPSQGEAAETAATSLAKASDLERAKVSELYTAADQEASGSANATDAADAEAGDTHSAIAANLKAEYEARAAAIERMNAAKRMRLAQGGGSAPIKEIPLPPKPEIPAPPAVKQGGGYIDVAGFRRALDNPEMANPTIEGVKSLRSGVKGLLDAYASDGGKITLEQAENIRQAINDAYDPLGGGINGHVGRLKASLDNALDSTDAGPAYKAARAAHKAWAEKYDNPEGISGLIKRDAQGNFINGDNWRKADNFIGATADKPFIQVVKQLKANGDEAAVQRLKAAVIQRAYEKATNNATDKLGNATINGKLFLAELNKVGSAKLDALFTPTELAELSTAGRASIHLNEAVPGTANTSHTASALAKALLKPSHGSGKGHAAVKAAAHAAALFKVPVLGNVVVEGVDRSITALGKHASAKNLAKALNESRDPVAARAKSSANAKRIADALRRKSTSRTVTKLSAPVIGATLQGHR